MHCPPRYSPVRFVWNVSFLFAAVLTPVISTANDSIHPVGHRHGYQLVWQDEFNGEQLDTTKWSIRHDGSTHGNATVDSTCVRLRGDGSLALGTMWDEQKGTYLCGMIGTSGKFERAYGYYEARLQFQRHMGMHCAFWLQSNRLMKKLDDTRFSGTEIDVIEYFGPYPKGLAVNLHWNGYGEHHRQAGKKIPLPESELLHDDFHVYGCLWTEDEYVFYIDGKEVWRSDQAVSGVRQYMILSNLSSPWELERLEKTRAEDGLPDWMLVDYVRVFRQVSPEHK